MNTQEKCPVCDWQITGGGIKIQVGSKEITVCCDECAAKVKEDPARYASIAS
jgi:ribosome-binding protein aMBF1 (putative translation factor)